MQKDVKYYIMSCRKDSHAIGYPYICIGLRVRTRDPMRTYV